MTKFTKKRRAYIYGLALTAGPVLAFYGLIDAKALPVFAPFLLALLNLSDDEA